MDPEHQAAHSDPEPTLAEEADRARRDAEHTVNGVAGRLRVPGDVARAAQEKARAAQEKAKVAQEKAQEKMASLRTAGRHLLDTRHDESTANDVDSLTTDVTQPSAQRKPSWRVAVAAVAAVLFVRRLAKRRKARAEADPDR